MSSMTKWEKNADIAKLNNEADGAYNMLRRNGQVAVEGLFGGVENLCGRHSSVLKSTLPLSILLVSQKPMRASGPDREGGGW